MPEAPTLFFHDSQTDRVFTHMLGDDEGGRPVLVDEEGHRKGVPEAELKGDFPRYRAFGIDLPVGVDLLRREDDGSETPLALEGYDEIPAPDESRPTWRAVFAAPDGTPAVLTEAALLEGLLEHPPVYRFA